MKFFVKFCAYIFLKYTLIFAYDFVIGGATWDWDSLRTREDWIYIGWMFLALPLLEIIILFFPFRIGLRQSGVLMYIILATVFIVEFFISWAVTNQKVETWMIAKVILSVILFLVMFKKQLIVK